jgi:two pore calcium channel protein
MVVLGAGRYFSSGVNRFDCAAAWLPAFAEAWALVQYGAAVAFDGNIARLVLLSRLLRLMRVFAHSPRFRVIADTMAATVPAAASLFGTLWVLMYTFSLVGVDAFGGAVYYGNPHLEGSEYQSSGYLELNFNDMMSGVVTLWCMLVVNDWSVLMEGIIRASGRTGLWRLYFMTFYIIAVVACLGVLTSFIIDSYMVSEGSREIRSLGMRRLRQSIAKLLEQEYEEEEDGEFDEYGAFRSSVTPSPKIAAKAAARERVQMLRQKRAEILLQLAAADEGLLAAQLLSSAVAEGSSDGGDYPEDIAVAKLVAGRGHPRYQTVTPREPGGLETKEGAAAAMSAAETLLEQQLFA